MVVNQKVTGRAASIPVGLGIGVLAGMLITIVGSAGIALGVNNGVLQETQIGYGVMGLLLLASFTGAWTAAAMIKHRRLLVCAGTGMGYYVALCIVNALAFGGQYSGMAVTALLVLGGSFCAALLGIRQNGSGKSGRRKIRTG